MRTRDSLDLLLALLQVLPGNALRHVSLEVPRCTWQGSVLVASPHKRVDLAPLLDRLKQLAPARLDMPAR